MLKTRTFIRHNAIALAALFVALGGTSYAVVTLPAGSVGAKQIRNHVIDPVKLDPKLIAGSIRASVALRWGAGGRLVALTSSRHVRVTTGTTGESVVWIGHKFPRSCLASATPQVNLNPGMHADGYVTTQFDPTSPHGAFLQLFGFAPDGTRSAQAADVLIVCV